MAIITGGPKVANLAGYTGQAWLTPIPSGVTRLSGGEWILADPISVTITDGTFEAGFTLSPGAYQVRVPGSAPVEIEVPDDEDTHDIYDLITYGPDNPPASPWVHGNLSGRDAAGSHPATAISVAATPAEYTPSAATVEAHLSAIDAKITVLLAAIGAAGNVRTYGFKNYSSVADLQAEAAAQLPGTARIDNMGTAVWRAGASNPHDGVKWIQATNDDSGRYEITGY